jgi:glycosyltransferase involved in cell wall biosynthesis
MTKPRIVLIARPYDISDQPYDGFVKHRLRVVEVLQQRYEVAILLLVQSHDDARPRDDLKPLVADELPVTVPPGSRAARLRGAARPIASKLNAEERRLVAAVHATGARAAVTFGPWLDLELQAVFGLLPTVHFFEEDLTQMPEIASQSLQARGFRGVENGLRRRARDKPRLVVYIGYHERVGVRRRYGGTQSHWHPYLLDPGEFPVATATASGTGVIVVGHFGQPRNAEGLAAVMEALPVDSRMPVSVVSGAGLHEMLRPYVADGTLSHLAGHQSVYRAYREARLTLVPATRVTGIKTTVLQAWAAGCPVVCSTPSAKSVGPFAVSAVLAGDSPDILAEHLVGAHDDETIRVRLAQEGRSVLSTHFDRSKCERELLAAIQRVVGG